MPPLPKIFPVLIRKCFSHPPLMQRQCTDYTIHELILLLDHHDEQYCIDKLNVEFQKNYCITFQDYQVRYVEFEILLEQANLKQKENIVKSLQSNKEILLNEIDRFIKSSVNTSYSWNLFNKIISLPSIEPDYFTQSIVYLKEYQETKRTMPNETNIFVEFLNIIQDKKLHEISQRENESLKIDILNINQTILNTEIKNNPKILKSLNQIHRCLKNIKYDADQNNINNPKASICGVDLGYFLIDQEIARELLSVNKKGIQEKQNDTGTHAVCKKNGVFYKPNTNNIYIIQPEIEFAIHSLYNFLGCKNAIAETTLLKIRNVIIEESNDYLEEVVQASLSIEGIPFHDFLDGIDSIHFIKRCIEASLPENYKDFLSLVNWTKPFDINYELLDCDENDFINKSEKSRKYFDFYKELKANEIFCAFIDDEKMNNLLDQFLQNQIDSCDDNEKCLFLYNLINQLKLEDKYEINNRFLQYNQFKNLEKRKLSMDEIVSFIFNELEKIQKNIREEDKCEELVTSRIYTLQKFIQQNTISDILHGLLIIQLYPELSTQIILRKGEIKKENVQLGIDLSYYIKKANIISKKIFPNLEDYKIFKELPNLLGKLDTTNLSYHFIASLLSNPIDHKPDNFIVKINRDEKNEILNFELIGIDNDQALEIYEIPIRTVIYSIPFFMELSIDETLKDFLINKKPEIFILDWIISLCEQNLKYNEWIKQEILKENDLIIKCKETNETKPKLNLPLEVQKGLFNDMYKKLKEIRKFLLENDNYTNWDLLHSIQPNVKEGYFHSMENNEILSEISLPSNLIIKKVQLDENLFQKIYVNDISNGLFLKEMNEILSLPDHFDVKNYLNVKIYDDSLYRLEKISQFFPIIANEISLPGNAEDPLSRKHLFFYCITENYCKIVFRLLNEEKNLNENHVKENSLLLLKTDEGQSGLLLACYHLQFEMIKILFVLFKGDPSICDSGKRNAIYIVIRYFKENPILVSSIIHLLGTHTSILWNQYCGDSEKLPIQYLVNILETSSYPEISEPLIEYFIKKGSSPDYMNLDGETSLDIAIKHKNKGIIRKLILLQAGKRIGNLKRTLDFFKENINDNKMKECLFILFSNSLYFRWMLTMNQFFTICKQGKIHSSSINMIENIITKIEDNDSNDNDQLVSLNLSEEIFDKLFDKKDGNIRKINHFGNRSVNHLEIQIPLLNESQSLFFKQNPEFPGIEYAVCYLSYLIFGHGTSFSTLVSFKCDVEFQIVNLFKNTKQSYPILISQGVQGENLHNYLKLSIEKQNQLEQLLDRNSFCESFLLSLLINYEDAKPDNFIVVKNKNLQYDIVCIDNDHAFFPPIYKQNKGDIVLVKCILYCFNIMNEIIHPIAREKFLSLSIDKVLTEWLYSIKNTNQLYKKLFADQPRYSDQSSGILLTCPFRIGFICEMYDRFKKIQTALLDKNITCMEILRIVMPPVGIRYEQAQKDKKTILERFLDISRTQYAIDTSNSRMKTLINSQECLKHMKIPNKKDFLHGNIENAIKELNDIKYQMQHPKNYQLIINNIKQLKFDEFNSILLNSEKSKIISLIDFSDIESVKNQRKVLSYLFTHTSYQSLHLHSCKIITEDLKLLLHNSPNIRTLELDNCTSATDEKITDHLRSFGDLDPDFLAALDYGIYLVNALCNFPMKLSYLSSLTLQKMKLEEKLNLTKFSLHSLKIINCDVIKTIYFNVSLKYLHLENCNEIEELKPSIFTKNKPIPIDKNFHIKKFYLSQCDKYYLSKIFLPYFQQEKKKSIVLRQFPLFFSRNNVESYLFSNIYNLSFAPIFNALFYYYKIIDEKKNGHFHFLLSKNPSIFNCILNNINVVSRFHFSFIDFSDSISHEISDTILKYFSHFFSDLQGISLSGCCRITDFGLSYFSQFCKQLTKINLQNCSQISDYGVISLVSNCNQLKSINLNFCDRITDDCLAFIATNCNHLTRIYLDSCDLITNAGIKHISCCSGLSKISFSGCNKITRACYSLLPDNCKILSLGEEAFDETKISSKFKNKSPGKETFRWDCTQSVNNVIFGRKQ